MGPNYNRQPDGGVPSNMPEIEAPGNDVERSTQQTHRGPEALTNVASQPPVLSRQAPVAQVPIASATPTSPSLTITTQDNTNPTVAADKDLIEKEWVDKAKHIVESTQDDPHKQTKEINLFKADYLKKRYNKELKVIEG